ncbi:putative polyketide hydroxylase [Streptoalloteichus tenebrarius]|uniref:Polyketide hydroxylase n=1 Tax=Streptoalloteichus tenebrarius (strain ATCC 17920 / DSM 40477 / JCM 4838 / CBS 697.72 / NBRC 16177 / NCIMB 11028 / NRRL B-12390 / A12253. 1 / ISP 5477) TaxID=1933 RepID=A0ABT1HLM1_STRSD|nr:FAD-dependent monooxygenase [Streptoalloteichus tenebrarius]MCP2256393.1 putative polyketide hydroxylase [Streptoalloteichus tenebrarius]BFF04740.1 FAD-dependent oxidoreductase [Streptoalloteichus tenebrarius]
MLKEDVPVLVVGGGPGGLASALFLAEQGIPVLLVERAESTSRLPRATHVSSRTMELLRTVGLEPRVRAIGMRLVPDDDPRARTDRAVLPRTVLAARNLAEIHDAQVLETGADELAVPGPCPPFWCGQDRTEPLLANAARERGARLWFGAELVSWTADEDGVTATVERRRDGTRRRVRARYLVAADGPHSTVREQAGVPVEGMGLISRWTSVLFHADLDRVLRGRRFSACVITDPDLPATVTESNDRHRWCLALETPADRAEPEDVNVARWLGVIRRVAGRPDLRARVEAVRRWPASHQLATRFRCGPVFLVGDCAHAHPPAGNHGANLAIQDAHNLAWKLAAVLKGWAGEPLLDTYEAERRPVDRATADQSALRAGVPGDRLGGITPCDTVSFLTGYRYQSAAVIGGGGPAVPAVPDLSGAPGTRLPHVWLTYRGRRLSSIDLCRDAPVLLTSEADAVPRMARAAARRRVPLRVYHVGVEGQFDAPDRAALWGGQDRGSVLVRPDGFVAWRGEGAPSEAVLGEVLGQVLAQGAQVTPWASVG